MLIGGLRRVWRAALVRVRALSSVPSGLSGRRAAADAAPSSSTWSRGSIEALSLTTANLLLFAVQSPHISHSVALKQFDAHSQRTTQFAIPLPSANPPESRPRLLYSCNTGTLPHT